MKKNIYIIKKNVYSSASCKMMHVSKVYVTCINSISNSPYWQNIHAIYSPNIAHKFNNTFHYTNHNAKPARNFVPSQHKITLGQLQRVRH